MVEKESKQNKPFSAFSQRIPNGYPYNYHNNSVHSCLCKSRLVSICFDRIAFEHSRIRLLKKDILLLNYSYFYLPRWSSPKWQFRELLWCAETGHFFQTFSPVFPPTSFEKSHGMGDFYNFCLKVKLWWALRHRFLSFQKISLHIFALARVLPT